MLVDPDRVAFLVDPAPPQPIPSTFPDNVLYIYAKQLEEADIIAINKADLLSPERRARLEEELRRQFPQARVVSISAKDGTGLDNWLDLVTGGDLAGRTIAEVDYDIYAEGEAALGWLNASYRLEANPTADWRSFCEHLMDSLREGFDRNSAEIAHLKIHLQTEGGGIVGNLTTTRGEPSWRGSLAPVSAASSLLINVWVHLSPDRLRSLVERCVTKAAGGNIRVVTEELQCFAPSRPVPIHRFANVV